MDSPSTTLSPTGEAETDTVVVGDEAVIASAGTTNNSDATAGQALAASAVSATDDSAPKVLKIASAKAPLTADERKQLRAQKFGETKASPQSNATADQKLQNRAQRFGTVVSEKLKKVEDSNKLMKRKERFGAITSTDTSSKRKISSSNDNKDAVAKRIARFGKV